MEAGEEPEGLPTAEEVVDYVLASEENARGVAVELRDDLDRKRTLLSIVAQCTSELLELARQPRDGSPEAALAVALDTPEARERKKYRQMSLRLLRCLVELHRQAPSEPRALLQAPAPAPAPAPAHSPAWALPSSAFSTPNFGAVTAGLLAPLSSQHPPPPPPLSPLPPPRAPAPTPVSESRSLSRSRRSRSPTDDGEDEPEPKRSSSTSGSARKQTPARPEVRAALGPMTAALGAATGEWTRELGPAAAHAQLEALQASPLFALLEQRRRELGVGRAFQITAAAADMLSKLVPRDAGGNAPICAFCGEKVRQFDAVYPEPELDGVPEAAARGWHREQDKKGFIAGRDTTTRVHGHCRVFCAGSFVELTKTHVQLSKRFGRANASAS
jgi:hypothetical protein